MERKKKNGEVEIYNGKKYIYNGIFFSVFSLCRNHVTMLNNSLSSQIVMYADVQMSSTIWLLHDQLNCTII